eukprot:4203364-Pleurochrysis_carterae.AAC.3
MAMKRAPLCARRREKARGAAGEERAGWCSGHKDRGKNDGWTNDEAPVTLVQRGQQKSSMIPKLHIYEPLPSMLVTRPLLARPDVANHKADPCL